MSETYSAVTNKLSLPIECRYESGVHMTYVFDLFSLFLLHKEIPLNLIIFFYMMRG